MTTPTPHTPGPWTVDDPTDKNPQRGSGGERVHKVVGTGRASGLVADVSAWWYDTETARANARLIAAAPQMRHFLAAWLAWSDAATDGQPDAQWTAPIRSLLSDLEA